MYVDLQTLPGIRARYAPPADDETRAWLENHVRDLRAQPELWADVVVRQTRRPSTESGESQFGFEISLYAVSADALQGYLDSDRTEVRRQAKANGFEGAEVFEPAAEVLEPSRPEVERGVGGFGPGSREG